MKKEIKGLLAAVLLISLTGCGKNYKTLYEEAMKDLSAGNYEEAVTILQEAIKVSPKKTDAYLALAGIYMDQGQAEEAIDTYTQLTANVPDYAPGFTGLGDAYLLQEDFNDAYDSYDQAVKLDPDSYEAQRGKVRTLLEQNDVPQADTEYEKLVKHDPETPDDYAFEIQMKWMNGDFKDADEEERESEEKLNEETSPELERQRRNMDKIRKYPSSVDGDKNGETEHWKYNYRLKPDADPELVQVETDDDSYTHSTAGWMPITVEFYDDGKVKSISETSDPYDDWTFMTTYSEDGVIQEYRETTMDIDIDVFFDEQGIPTSIESPEIVSFDREDNGDTVVVEYAFDTCAFGAVEPELFLMSAAPSQGRTGIILMDDCDVISVVDVYDAATGRFLKRTMHSELNQNGTFEVSYDDTGAAIVEAGYYTVGNAPQFVLDDQGRLTEVFGSARIDGRMHYVITYASDINQENDGPSV